MWMSRLSFCLMKLFDHHHVLLLQFHLFLLACFSELCIQVCVCARPDSLDSYFNLFGE